MRRWDKRAKEVAYLLNPSFCGLILYNSIKEYEKETSTSFPFFLAYLILPLVLHRKTREKISSRTQMHIWLQKNPELLIDFSKRVNDIVEITNETIRFLLQCKVLEFDKDAAPNLKLSDLKLKEEKIENEEIDDCIRKAKHVARWFSKGGTVETIYINFGVRL